MISISSWLSSFGVMSNNPSNSQAANSNPPTAAINIVQSQNNNNSGGNANANANANANNNNNNNQIQNHGNGSGGGHSNNAGQNISPSGSAGGAGSVIVNSLHHNLAAEGSMERGR